MFCKIVFFFISFHNYLFHLLEIGSEGSKVSFLQFTFQICSLGLNQELWRIEDRARKREWLKSRQEKKRRGWQRSFVRTGGRALTNSNWVKVLSPRKEAERLCTTGGFLKVTQSRCTITLFSHPSIRYDFKPTSIDQEGLGTLEVIHPYLIWNS